MTITHRSISTNGINMHIAESGEGPLVLLLHGFPELWYSYRHQLEALAAAGYHAVAPDQRGYGTTDSPYAISEYTMLHLVGDVVGLLAALGEKDCVVVGHDWGSPVASTFGLLRPDLVRGVALLSVPYLPRGDADVLTAITGLLGPDNYQMYFQESGVAETVLEANVHDSVLGTLFGLSGDAPEVADSGTPMLPLPVPEGPLPGWLTADDVNYFTAEFARTGFRGPLNWYRTSVLNWELLGPWHNAQLLAPSLFIGGDRDIVYHWPGFSDIVPILRDISMPNLTKSVVLEGCGHWTQQERPDEVNRLLEEFLSGLPN
jgi:pimeloyl-ACP methyl ester carboxylesterase